MKYSWTWYPRGTLMFQRSSVSRGYASGKFGERTVPYISEADERWAATVAMTTNSILGGGRMTTGIITKLRNIHLSVHPPTPLTLSLRIRNQAGFTARTRYSTLHGTVHSDYPNLRTRTHPQAKPSGDKSERSTGVKAHLLQGKQNTSKTTLLEIKKVFTPHRSGVWSWYPELKYLGSLSHMSLSPFHSSAPSLNLPLSPSLSLYHNRSFSLILSLTLYVKV